MNKIKKILNTVGNAIAWALVVLAVFMIIFTIISTTVLERSERNLFGYRGFVVLSDSMSATDFDAGDIVFVRSVDPATLKEGDIISYISVEPGREGDVITHKIRSLVTDENGNPGFITYGTTTDTDDEIVVTYPMVAGKYAFSLPGIGKFFSFLQTAPGYILFIFLPLAIIIVVQTLNSIKLFRRFKSQQTEQTEQFQKEVADQEAEKARIIAELLEIRKQLEAQTDKNNTSKEEQLNEED